MKIEMNTIYHLPTQAHEDDFLKQAERQGLVWCDGTIATKNKQWSHYKEEHCVSVRNGKLDGWGNIMWYEMQVTLPIIEWKIGFTKTDMQIGQMYRTRNKRICEWSMQDTGYYDKNLKWCGSGSGEDIIEVYPLNLTPIWKREEPKYRVKTELTREQAEKLGLEFCEEVTG